MSKTTIPPRTVSQLWVRAGGRCEYTGCNELLYRDELTQAAMNRAYVAHIVADEAGGPRGDAVLSPKLAKEFSNLMLLCDPHHRLIDTVDVPGHPVELLQRAKQDHEDRIELVTSIAPNLRTQIVIFQAAIGNQKVEISLADVQRAVLPARYPVRDVIRIDLTGSSRHENEADFWTESAKEMQHQVEARVRWSGDASRRDHVSLFALGPIPLLAAFGRAVGDKLTADIFQSHRDTATWCWPPLSAAALDFRTSALRASPSAPRDVAVSFAISTAVSAHDVSAAMTGEYSHYEIGITTPSRTAVRSTADVASFGLAWHGLVERLRHEHGADCRIHVFPALPASLAVQLGRVLLPKLHPPILIYDYNSTLGGFCYALTLGAQTTAVGAVPAMGLATSSTVNAHQESA